MSTINKYWDALDRMKNNKSINLPKNSNINNDNVALEAGRNKGSIKKSREIFSELVQAIKIAAAAEQAKKKPDMKIKLQKERSKKLHYKELYHEALNRELMLLKRLAEIEKSFGNIIPIK